MNRRRFIYCATTGLMVPVVRAAIPFPLGFFKSGCSASAQFALADWVARVQTAGSSVSTSKQAIVCQFIDGLMADGVWLLSDYIEVYAADTLTGLAAALVDHGAGVTVTGFVSGDYTANGLIGGTGKELKTANLPGSVNSVSMGFYTRTDLVTTAIPIGSANGANSTRDRYIHQTTVGPTTNATLGSATISVVTADTKGFFFSSRITSTDHRLYRNGVQIGFTAVAPGAGPNTSNAWIHAVNLSEVEFLPSSQQICFSWLGVGLDATQAANLYARVQTLQTGFGRQI